ncbi:MULTISPECIES: dipeptide epimerase [Bacillus]|uniref:dipeptide epimerase n=1 Tax=Bacillus TaxID=1386 RepID=UPI0015830AF4|nr:dipeptide epimerase [Bacillus glycinifermentans]MBU8787230.1 dipeptide epimerase [Bacillus glycinifermentans]NUJ17275.1 dipeptide epimerase [Bacillus glycinifermentans]
MKITGIHTYRIAVPLVKPFKTALRTVHTAEAVIVKMSAENAAGWGEAPPTAVITGETLDSIESAIKEVFAPALTGRSLLRAEAIFHDIGKLISGNTSAKAAVDMAVYDCLSQMCGLPLYQFLGGYRREMETDFTVSVNDPDEMGEDAAGYEKAGFRTLKVKVGKDDIETDLARIREIRRRTGPGVKLRLDANQGWTPKQAIRAIKKMEDEGLEIELVEQPVHKGDLAGLKRVTDAVDTLIMADESVFSPEEAFQVLKTRSADLINIKLMKAGGIKRALQINAIAEACGVECMAGSMIETRLGITAAAHFAASQKNVTRFDFDAPLMLNEEIVEGGVSYAGSRIVIPDAPGLGITDVKGEAIR